MTTKDPTKPQKYRKPKPTTVPPPPPPTKTEINTDALLSALIKFQKWHSTDEPEELERLRQKDKEIKELLRRILIFLRELPDKKLPKKLYDEIFRLMADIDMMLV